MAYPDDIHLPALSEELIQHMDELFPEQSADLAWTDRQVWFKAGERNVVRFLREQYERQTEDVRRRR